MGDEITPAPQSIVIQASTAMPTELPDIAAVPTEPVASPEDQQPEATNYLAQAIERYESLKLMPDAGNGFAVFGLIVMVVSLFIGASAVMDGLGGGTGDGVELCFGGLFIGLLLGLGGAASSASYQGKLKKALAEVKTLADLPEKEATSSYVAPGAVLIGAGLLLTVNEAACFGSFGIAGGVVILLSGAMGGFSSENPDNVLVAAKEVLRRNE